MAYESTPDVVEPVGPIDDEVMPDKDQIILDASDPKIAAAFETCEPGETLTLESKDEGEIVLSKNYEADDEGETDADEMGMAEPTSAVDRLMKKKMGA